MNKGIDRIILMAGSGGRLISKEPQQASSGHAFPALVHVRLRGTHGTHWHITTPTHSTAKTTYQLAPQHLTTQPPRQNSPFRAPPQSHLIPPQRVAIEHTVLFVDAGDV